MAKRVWAFSNGTEFDIWADANCNRCTKQYDYEKMEGHCDLEEAIMDAGASDGKVASEIAQRLGWKSCDVAHGLCPEKVPF